MRFLCVALAAVAASACGSSTPTSTTTAPTPLGASTATLAVSSFAATLQPASPGAVYRVTFTVNETGGQTGATLRSVVFVFRNGYSSGALIYTPPSTLHVATGGAVNIGPVDVADPSGNLATEISATVSYADDSGHDGSVSGSGTLPVVTFGLVGVVTDSTTSLPLAGVTVSLTSGPDAPAATMTDANGRYAFPKLQAGTINVTAEDSGYTALTQSVTVAANAESDFALVPVPPAAASSLRRGR
jgi:hypothetical protein